MKRNLIKTLIIPALLFASCSGHDAELEKELNTKIDNYIQANAEVCECVNAVQGDCAEERKKADDVYKELSFINNAETEQKLDPAVYTSMLESIALTNSDYAKCTQALFKRLNDEE